MDPETLLRIIVHEFILINLSYQDNLHDEKNTKTA